MLLQPALDDNVSEAGLSHCAEAFCLQEDHIGISLIGPDHAEFIQVPCQTHVWQCLGPHLNAQHEGLGLLLGQTVVNESLERNKVSDRKLNLSQHSASFLPAAPLFTVLQLPTA